MIWATISTQSCFCWLYRASPSLAAKNIINLILVLTVWWCSCVKSSLVLLEEADKGLSLPTKVHLVKAMVFPVITYGCENWTIKKAERRRTDVFELWCWRRLLSPLDCKEIKPVHPKGNQPWIVFERTDAETEAPIFWPPDAKNWLIGKDPDAVGETER